mgnify:FL=1|jgi:UDP-N-acetylglucosamine 2-epimerase (hydrolysing)
MKKIALMTGKRGGWDACRPLVAMLDKSSNFVCDVLITDQHLQPEFGYTAGAVADQCMRPITIGVSQERDSIRARLNAGAEELSGFSDYITNHSPDLVLVYGDRLEALMLAIACHTHRIPFAHMQSGDRTGGLDEGNRRAIEELASWHYCSMVEHAEFLRCHLGCLPIEHPTVTGDQHLDRIRLGRVTPAHDLHSKYGLFSEVGLDLDHYCLLMYHPNTDGRSITNDERTALDVALRVTYPNNVLEIKGCSDPFYISAQGQGIEGWPVLDTVPSEDFLGLLANAQFIIGNSSAGIIEAPYMGTPSINVGTRQHGRIQYGHTRDATTRNEIGLAIGDAISAKHNPPSAFPYGTGHATEVIFQHLVEWSQRNG